MNTMTTGLDALLDTAPKDLQPIGEKILEKQRITPEEGILLFEKGGLPFLGALANHVRERLHGNVTYFNRNFHIEQSLKPGLLRPKLSHFRSSISVDQLMIAP